MKVMVVDDEPMLRTSLVQLLRQEPDVEVVASAGDGEEAVAKALRFQPEVVLMDVQMPVMDGIEATRRIREARPDVQVVILTHLSNDEPLFAAIKAGAIGYVLKDATVEQVVESLRSAKRGEATLYPSLAARVFREFNRMAARSQSQREIFEALSKREVEVLELLAKGKRNREIADELFLSERTVKNHVGSILAKLHVNDRTEAALIAAKHGLGG